MSEGALSRRALAWTVAAVQVLALAQGVLFFGWSGVWSAPEISVPGVMAFAAVGALIVSQRGGNRLGWLLLSVPIPVTMNVLVLEYADLSVLHHVVGLPFVSLALWIVNWAWTPFVGSFPVILARFPTGRLPHRWRFVDWLSVGGTILLAVGLAVSSADVGNNVFASAPLHSAGGALLVTGLTLIAVAMVGAASLLWERYRRGDQRLRSQLKWILLAAILVTVTSIYMAIVELAYRVPFGDAMLPSTVALACIPIAIGVAVLRHQLFDIDVIVNRTLVYVILTAILGGLYIGVIELVQRLFVIYTGETSDTAIVITAFIVAAAFTPLQKWIDRLVERRFGGRDAAARAYGITATMQSVVRVIDAHRVARWVVDELVTAFEAEGGAIYLDAHDRARPFHLRGRLTGKAAVEVAVQHDGRSVGRLLLGPRRGGVEYSHRDLESLRAAAASLAEALVLAGELGHLVQAHAATPDPAPQRLASLSR